MAARRRHKVSQVVRSFVRLSVRYQTCEHDILKMNETILMQIYPRGKVMKRPTWSQEVKGQGHTSYEAENRFEDLSETSLSTPLGRVGFLKSLYSVILSSRCPLRVLTFLKCRRNKETQLSQRWRARSVLFKILLNFCCTYERC